MKRSKSPVAFRLDLWQMVGKRFELCDGTRGRIIGRLDEQTFGVELEGGETGPLGVDVLLDPSTRIFEAGVCASCGAAVLDGDYCDACCLRDMDAAAKVHVIHGSPGREIVDKIPRCACGGLLAAEPGRRFCLSCGSELPEGDGNGAAAE